MENTDAEIGPVPLLWASKRIGDLEDQHAFGAEKGSRQQERKNGSVRDAVIDLSRSFGIISRYTSFVALEERSAAEKSVGAPLLRRIPVPVAIGWHGMGSVLGRGRYEAGAVNVVASCVMDYSSGEDFCVSSDRNVRFCIGDPPRRKILDVPTFLRMGSLSAALSTSSHRRFGSDAASTSGRQKILLQILSLQKAEGGMKMDKPVARKLHLDFQNLKNISHDIKTEKGVDRFLLLTTAVLLRILEIDFGDQRQTWEGVVMKSRKWLMEMVVDAKPTLEDQALLAWVEDAVKNKTLLGKSGGIHALKNRIREGLGLE